MAGYGPMPADLPLSQGMDADRLAKLLDRIGPAIVMTHSASGPDGWLVADRRPGLVRAVVSVEPMGPPFADTPGIGALAWGVTACPVGFDPPRATAAEVRSADPASLRVPAWAGVPMLVVTGETSAFVAAAEPVVAFLNHGGAAAERLHLPDHGVTGNGHGLIYESNSDDAPAPRPAVDGDGDRRTPGRRGPDRHRRGPPGPTAALTRPRPSAFTGAGPPPRPAPASSVPGSLRWRRTPRRCTSTAAAPSWHPAPRRAGRPGGPWPRRRGR